MQIKLAAGTNVGLVRNNNEDNFVVNSNLEIQDWTVPQCNTSIELSKYGALMVVADGMGGLNAGEVASRIAIETVQSYFSQESLDTILKNGTHISDEAIEDFLIGAIKSADLNIINTSNNDDSAKGMGTTIVIAWLIENKVHVAWCGDSRCYIFNGSSFRRISKDHSYVQELIDSGKLKPEYAIDHPCSNIITRCLGDSNNRAKPDYTAQSIKNGDIILLCSDGLCGLCTDNDIMDIIEKYGSDMNECRDMLITAALNAGGYDNVTLTLCKISNSNNDEPNEQSTEESILGKTLDTSPHKNLLKRLFGRINKDR